MKTTPLRWIVVLGTAAMLVVASCSNGSGSDSGSAKADDSEVSDDALFDPSVVNKPVHEGTPERGGEITYGLEGDVLNISPNQSMIQPPDVQLGSAVYDPLIGFDDEGLAVTDNTDHAQNQLAERLEPSDDLKTWTLTLREGVKFSNGVDLTAQQVVDQTEWVKASGSCDCDADARNIAEITAPDPQTVVYTLTEPVVDFPTKLNRGGLAWITESGARDAADNPNSPGMAHLIGTGAFVFDSNDGDSYTVVANENYYGTDPTNDDAELPYLDEITFMPLADTTTRLQAVQSGSVQIMQTADTANLAQAKDDSELTVQPAQGTSATILGLNLTQPPFGVEAETDESAQQTAIRGLADPTALKARQAFNLAFNRNELNQKVYEGTRTPAYSLIPENNPWHDEDPDAQLPRHDAAKAKELVGQVKQAGVTADITTLCLNSSYAKNMFAIAQQNLEAAGFTASLEPVEQAILVQNLLAGSGDISWDVACFRTPQLADPNGLTNALTTGGATNFVKYSRPDVDGWMSQGRESSDTEERKGFYNKVQGQLAADVVYIPTLYDYYGNVFSSDLSGLSAPSPISLGIIAPGGLYKKS